MGLTLGLFDGFSRLMSFCRSIHSRWASVTYADPVRDEKFPIMTLDPPLSDAHNLFKDSLPDKHSQDHDGPQQVIYQEKDRIGLRNIGLRLLPFASDAHRSGHDIDPSRLRHDLKEDE